MKIRVCIILMTVISGVAMAGTIHSDKGCKTNPEVVGSCFTIHGKIFTSNGTPSVRIWKVGTNRVLGVLPSENEIMPSVIKSKLNFETQIFGDYLVCPFTIEKKGHMQMVCIESVQNLSIKKQ
jgi:hypothetical protein